MARRSAGESLDMVRESGLHQPADVSTHRCAPSLLPRRCRRCSTAPSWGISAEGRPPALPSRPSGTPWSRSPPRADGNRVVPREPTADDRRDHGADSRHRRGCRPQQRQRRGACPGGRRSDPPFQLDYRSRCQPRPSRGATRQGLGCDRDFIDQHDDYPSTGSPKATALNRSGTRM